MLDFGGRRPQTPADRGQRLTHRYGQHALQQLALDLGAGIVGRQVTIRAKQRRLADLRASLFGGMERWNGMVEWNGGME